MFKPGKLTIVMDGGAGSSGKGTLGSYICDQHDNWQFACNSFSAQAGHWVKLDDGRQFFYQQLNSCAYAKKYEKLYVGPDSAIELPAMLREIEENNVKEHELGIHPLATVIQPKDMAYERGEVNFDGDELQQIGDGTKKHGSTCHGTGPARVRKMLRRKDTLLAKDVAEFKPYLCDVSAEIMARLDKGQSGMLEIAQGFQLSLNGQFYPHCTNRNVTVSAALDGMMLPPIYAGDVVINFRTFPIRISSYKYLGENNRHLTWEEVQQYDAASKEYTTECCDSGGWYPDQTEMSWDDITKQSGSPTPIIELTSVTKLPRRVATFSRKCLEQSIKYNRTHGDTFISINFINYVDHSMTGKRGCHSVLTPKVVEWLQSNVLPIVASNGARLMYLGTGARTDDKIVL